MFFGADSQLRTWLASVRPPGMVSNPMAVKPSATSSPFTKPATTRITKNITGVTFIDKLTQSLKVRPAPWRHYLFGHEPSFAAASGDKSATPPWPFPGLFWISSSMLCYPGFAPA